ncbi:nitroreductase [Candidatus Micrarchaeota archaeon]|nr:nitroreductase [Candidatus Micrarchaeota archaeon]
MMESMEGLTDEVKKHRKPDYGITPLLVNRWSPRAMTGEKIDDGELMALFEAARWAPSAFNGQLWRFIYAKRDTRHWDRIFALLGEWNQNWCRNAAVLVVIVTRKLFEYNDKPSRTCAFDCGAAWENLALEGTARGLVVHGMSGFGYERAREELGIPEKFGVMAMCAIGRRAPKDALPEDMQEKEFPKGRRPLEEIVMEGKFRS